MADQVEQIMQEMVPELDDLRRKGIFDEDEMRQIIKRRRDFEYLLHRVPGSSKDYLGYVQYEVAMECLRKRRSKALNWRKKTISDYAGINRMHSIFNRGLAKYKGDVRLWYQHVDFCLRSGSNKILQRVLMKAVKFHPREIHFWLLAADRELKHGHIKSARALLLRGLRFSPGSAKLWSEFVRLECQVASNLCSLKQAAAASEAPTATTDAFADKFEAEKKAEKAAQLKEKTSEADAWAPTRLIFQRSLARLSKDANACMTFLTTVAHVVEDAFTTVAAADSDQGLLKWQRELFAAVAERRTGADTASPAWEGASDEVAMQIWELWWTQERSQGRGWRGIARSVLAHAPLPAVRHCASSLGKAMGEESQASGAPLKALVEFSSAERVTNDAETALSVLEVFESVSSLADVNEHASALIVAAESSVAASDACSVHDLRLALVSSRAKGSSSKHGRVAKLLKKASNLTSGFAVDIFTLIASSDDESDHAELLETLLRSLAPEASPRVLVEVFLSRALLTGLPSFQDASKTVLSISAKLWNAPQLRGAILAVILEAELRVLTPCAESAKVTQSRFEELLTLVSDADPAKVDCWIRYLEFVQRAAQHGLGHVLPSSSDLHLRAMRSVPDQAAYIERARQAQMSVS